MASKQAILQSLLISINYLKVNSMKYSITAGFLLLLSFSILSYAANAQTATAPIVDMVMHHGMGMMNNMTEEQKNEHMCSMQEHMLKMHDLSNQILSEKDLAKKESLKKQQLELMKAHHAQMMLHHN
jgi:hypothetical protein